MSNSDLGSSVLESQDLYNFIKSRLIQSLCAPTIGPRTTLTYFPHERYVTIVTI